jgi:hypothetical protein
MTADDETTRAAKGSVDPLDRPRQRLRPLARRVAGPYLRRRRREAETAAALERLQGELEHLGTRHSEQIERLEDFVRELIRTAETLRAEIAAAAASALPAGGLGERAAEADED